MALLREVPCVDIVPHVEPRLLDTLEDTRQIRLDVGLSQTEMYRRLETDETILYTRISDYELDKNEPSLMTKLAYARVAGVHMEDLVDDELDLPAKLPGHVTHRGPKRKPTSRKR